MILKTFKLSVLFLILGQIVAFPVLAARKKFVLVPVYQSGNSEKQIELAYQSFSERLENERKIKLVEQSKVLDYFLKEQTGDVSVSEGDQLYYEAKQDYLQFQTKQALKKLEKAFEKYELDPGHQGGAFQAYLLKALIELEKGQASKSRKSLSKAVMSNLNQEELKDNFYPPRFRKMYSSVYKQIVKEEKITNILVQVVGKNKVSSVFANGVPIKRGPEVSIKAIAEQPLFLQAGIEGKLYKVKPKFEQENKIRIRGKFKNSTKGQSFGFESTTPNLVQESQWLAKDVAAEQVILMYLQKHQAGERLSVTVIDAAKGHLTEPKHFEMASVKKDIDQATQFAAQYVANLSKKSFSPSQSDSMPIIIGQKKSSKAIWAILGATVIAAGVTTFVVAGGGDSPDAGVRVTLPEETE